MEPWGCIRAEEQAQLVERQVSDQSQQTVLVPRQIKEVLQILVAHPLSAYPFPLLTTSWELYLVGLFHSLVLQHFIL